VSQDLIEKSVQADAVPPL